MEQKEASDKELAQLISCIYVLKGSHCMMLRSLSSWDGSIMYSEVSEFLILNF